MRRVRSCKGRSTNCADGKSVGIRSAVRFESRVKRPGSDFPEKTSLDRPAPTSLSRDSGPSMTPQYLPASCSNELQLERAPHDSCGTLQRSERYVSVLRIEKAADLAAARVHALGKAFAREVLRFHCFGNLPREDFLDCNSLELFKLPFFFE